MKTYNKTYLPDEIIYKGEIFKRDYVATEEYREGKTILSGRYHILVKVLSNNLKGREDFHGKIYKPTEWIFSNELGLLRSTFPVKVLPLETPAYKKAMKQIKTFGY